MVFLSDRESQNSRPRAPGVVESDASDPIVLTWTEPRQLNIDVGNISQIATSVRLHIPVVVNGVSRVT